MRARAGLAVFAAALACCPAAVAEAKPRLALTERAGVPGERVGVTARGFPARERALLTLGGRPLRRSTVGRRGATRLRFRVPARRAGRYRLTVRAGGRVAHRPFRILAPAPPPPPPPPPPPVVSTLVAAGDIACTPGQPETLIACRHARTAALAESLAPDAVAVLGDLQYQTGTLAGFQGSYGPTWGRLLPITHPVPGNHEYEGDTERDTAPGYFSYFGSAAGDPATGYYRWDLPSWTLFALNSGALGYTRTEDELIDDCWPVSCAIGSGQETWLRTQLATLPPGQCVIGYWHHPRESSGFNNAYQPHEETEPLVDALRDHGAELILTSHSHNYERFDLGGITQFVVGTGGRSLHTATGQPPLTTTLRTDVFGVLELTLGPTSWSSRLVAESGESIDPASGSC